MKWGLAWTCVSDVVGESGGGGLEEDEVVGVAEVVVGVEENVGLDEVVGEDVSHHFDHLPLVVDAGVSEASVRDELGSEQCGVGTDDGGLCPSVVGGKEDVWQGG